MPRVRVVLVRPESPTNVGASARALRNAGLHELVLVAPGDWRTVECWRTAWGAHDVLERAQVTDGLSAALAGIHLAVALSGKRQGGAPAADIREAAVDVAALEPGQEAALVFGPEASGLTQDELALCGRRAFIPSHPGQPSLNLSHAVMVAGYEVFRATARAHAPSSLATHDEKEAMLALLGSGLRAIRALSGVNSDGYFRQWRALVQRADLTSREVRLLEHMAHKMMAAAGRGTTTPEPGTLAQRRKTHG